MHDAGRKRLEHGAIGRLLVLLAALAGLFAMHGLADHGSGGASAVASSPMAGHAAMSNAPAQPDVRTSDAADHHAPAHEHSMEMTALCLAVLVALLTMATVAWRRSTPRFTTWLDALPVLRRTSNAWRPAGPPGRFALSILRC